jgi:hypothetical protein
MSGVEVNGSWVRKGAVDAILDYPKVVSVQSSFGRRCGAETSFER